MSISKRTLAVIYAAALYQLWNGSFALNEDIVAMIERLVDRKTLYKLRPTGLDEIRYELKQIGKPNKRNKKAKVKS